MTLNQLIYRATRPLGGLKVARFLSRNHPKILMYHRITEDPEGEGIPVEQFKRQVEIIKKHFNPLTLRELMTAHEEGRVPKHAVCVTFDDGYADFAELAFPILKRAGVPATLFVTTGFVNGDLWLWPDEIRYIVNKTKVKNIKIDGMHEEINVQAEKHKAWQVISDYCLSISNSEKLDFIKRMYRIFDVKRPNNLPNEYKSITWDKIKELQSDGLNVESHSVSHPILTKLDQGGVNAELSNSKAILEKNLGEDVKIFCYPNGQLSDFNEDIKRWLVKCGYTYGVTAFSSISPIKDPLEIGRYPANNSAEEFEKTIFGISYLGLIVRGQFGKSENRA
ncbi:polysaccharide deacetylase family protein [Marinobacter sp. HN1S83]|uniref:polysaccharide deacetylase family protein n=1 Tax=Marinobacter sp. HN1S83 TaxID=3382301 RepID=UPI00387B221A